MLFVLTNSYDGTVDLLIRRLPQNKVFRFNSDLFNTYKIQINDDGFEIQDNTGRRITSDIINKFYFRKPWIEPTEDVGNVDSTYTFRSAELRYVLLEMINLLWAQGKVVLVEPYAERRCGKLIQLMIAKKFFVVPKWAFKFQADMTAYKAPQIVKTLSGEQVSQGKVMYTTQVNPVRLDPSYPWFIQDYVEAVKDVTVVYCRNKLFAYYLPRTFVKQSSDWREYISEQQIWCSFELPTGLDDNIRKFMDTLCLHYGRLDFLLTSDNQYFFCEVNPNGQYAWLDLDGKGGLLDCIVSEISPVTPLTSIPHACPVIKKDDAWTTT